MIKKSRLKTTIVTILIMQIFFPITVYGKNITAEEKINSRAYVVIDRNSNTILLGNNEHQKRKMASTTKIMTATIILENCNLKETIEVSKKLCYTKLE